MLAVRVGEVHCKSRRARGMPQERGACHASCTTFNEAPSSRTHCKTHRMSRSTETRTTNLGAKRENRPSGALRFRLKSLRLFSARANLSARVMSTIHTPASIQPRAIPPARDPPQAARATRERESDDGTTDDRSSRRERARAHTAKDPARGRGLANTHDEQPGHRGARCSRA